MSKFKLAEIISTFFYLGKIKYCPGTIGSLVAYPLCYFLMNLVVNYHITLPISNLSFEENQLLTLFSACFLLFLFLFIIGIYYSSIYSASINKQDPKEVIIDEVAGQVFTIIFCAFSLVFIDHSNIPNFISPQISNFIFLALMPFILFRLFDIFKPWPINWIDKNLKGGFGIMADDLLAAIFAIVIHYAITITIIDVIQLIS